MIVNDCFPLFSALPNELHFKIWEITFPTPVIVRFRSHTDDIGLSQVVRWPILSANHASIAQACKDAWQATRRTHHRVKFVAETNPPPPCNFDRFFGYCLLSRSRTFQPLLYPYLDARTSLSLRGEFCDWVVYISRTYRNLQAPYCISSSSGRHYLG